MISSAAQIWSGYINYFNTLHHFLVMHFPGRAWWVLRDYAEAPFSPGGEVTQVMKETYGLHLTNNQIRTRDGWVGSTNATSVLCTHLEKILTEQSQQDFISSLSSNYCNSPFTDLKKNWRFSRNFRNLFGWVATNKFHFVGKFPFIASCPHASVTPAVVSIVNKLCHAGIVVFGPQISKLAIF